ncbi:hypothetical protein PVAP13_9NG328800 [Panicum virgatum]|uniref:Uncharacterized protein n=2 Tax=Panicum virgatum TaxID=38727 RepID=A0A8T0MP75_PANVG|nr:hypothetical protein PVAP13_9NG328800 [Panicum virgatum]
MGSPTYQTGDENPSLAAADGGRLVKLSSWKSATQPPTPPLFRHPTAVSPQRAVLFAFLPTTASMDRLHGPHGRDGGNTAASKMDSEALASCGHQPNACLNCRACHEPNMLSQLAPLVAMLCPWCSQLAPLVAMLCP